MYTLYWKTLRLKPNAVQRCIILRARASLALATLDCPTHAPAYALLQALITYGVRADDVVILREVRGAVMNNTACAVSHVYV